MAAATPAGTPARHENFGGAGKKIAPRQPAKLPLACAAAQRLRRRRFAFPPNAVIIFEDGGGQGLGRLLAQVGIMLWLQALSWEFRQVKSTSGLLCMMEM
jgi:hypothetical protein